MKSLKRYRPDDQSKENKMGGKDILACILALFSIIIPIFVISALVIGIIIILLK